MTIENTNVGKSLGFNGFKGVHVSFGGVKKLFSGRGETYRGREWAEWQSRWDALPQSQKRIIWNWAALNLTGDSQFMLRALADIETGNLTYDTIEKNITEAVNKKADLSYDDMKTSQDPYAEFWTREQFREAFNKRWKKENYDAEAEITALNVVRDQISAEFDAAVKEGTIDRETGKPIDKDKVAQGSAELDNLFSDMGLDKTQNKPLYDHLAEGLRKNELDIYEAKQMMMADPAYLQQEYEKNYALWIDKLPEYKKEELALIDKEGKRLKAEQEKFFREDISPTIRREVGLLGGRGREFQSNALAKSAAELEQQRGDYMSKLRLNTEFADVERRRMAEAGRFEDIKGITAFGGEQGLKAQERVLTQKMRTLDTLNKLSMKRSEILTIRAAERYNRDYMKEQKRLEKEQLEKQRSAQRKARKYGMFANVFQGMTTGAMAGAKFGPYAALGGAFAGGISGYATSYFQNQGADVSAPNYFLIGRGAGSLIRDWRGRPILTRNQLSYGNAGYWQGTAGVSYP